MSEWNEVSVDFTRYNVPMKRLYGAIASSQNPEEVANKVKGAILAASFLIIFVAGQVFNITITADDVLTAATQIGAIVGTAWSLYGMILHLVTYFGSYTDNRG